MDILFVLKDKLTSMIEGITSYQMDRKQIQLNVFTTKKHFFIKKESGKGDVYRLRVDWDKSDPTFAYKVFRSCFQLLKREKKDTLLEFQGMLYPTGPKSHHVMSLVHKLKTYPVHSKPSCYFLEQYDYLGYKYNFKFEISDESALVVCQSFRIEKRNYSLPIEKLYTKKEIEVFFENIEVEKNIIKDYMKSLSKKLQVFDPNFELADYYLPYHSGKMNVCLFENIHEAKVYRFDHTKHYKVLFDHEVKTAESLESALCLLEKIIIKHAKAKRLNRLFQ